MVYTAEVRPLPTTADVAKFLGWPADDPEAIQPHLTVVTEHVKSYVRGQTFVGFSCAADIAGVVLAATARSLANPNHSTRVELGTFSEMPGKLEGFTILERLTLDRYRRRTA